MAATSTRHATAATSTEVIPACPRCSSAMVVRAHWQGGRVHGLYWACRRAPGCEGTRRIKSPDAVRPISHDASAQAIFDWESTRDRRESRWREQRSAPAPAAAGLRGVFGRFLSRPAGDADYEADGHDGSAVGYFDGLVEVGYVVLENRALPSARAVIGNLVIGPPGLFVVERKAWPGQIGTTADAIYVDGRQRVGAADDVARGATALEQTLAYELKPLGAPVHAAMLFERAANRSFAGMLGKVLIGGTRGLPKQMRAHGEPILGPETIVRLALTADRLLE